MRSISSLRARGGVALAAILLMGLVGCSKKTTAPNSRPVPEGQQNGQLLMMGWHEQRSVWFNIIDPGTPNTTLDDVLGQVATDFFADSNGVRTTTFDRSQSNQIEAFRIGTDQNVTPMFDFMLDPTVRLIGSDFESYDFEDFAPAPDPKYYGRGVLNGQVTTASPVSNRAGAFPTIDDNMIWNPTPKQPKSDSTLKISFVDDPRAVFYVVEVGDASGVLGTGDVFSRSRRQFGIPSPLLPGTLPERGFTFVLPGGLGQTGVRATLSSRRWPLFFHIRVSAFDGEGRMLNRVNDYLHTHTTDGGNNIETYEPLGGSVQVLDPYPDPVNPISPPPVLTRDQAFALLESKGGVPGRGQVTYVGRGALVGPGTNAPSAAFSDAMRSLMATPGFSKAATDQRFRAILAKLAAAPTQP